MDWSLTHLLNGFLFRHDAVEDPLTFYVNAAELLFAGVLAALFLLSRTRRDKDFALDCWDCSKNKIEELQLQITPAPGEPKFDAPGGFLFVNWERSSVDPATN